MGSAAVRLARAPLRPSRQDVVLAAAAAAAGQVVVWSKWGTEPFYGSRPYNAALSFLLLGALAWWRRAPAAATLWYVTLFCGLQFIAPHDLPAWTGYFPLVLLVAAAGRREPLLPSVVALVVALGGFGLLGVLEPSLHSADTLVFDALVLLLPWLAGRLLAVRSARTDALEADLASLAATQDERERAVLAQERARMARELHDVVAHSVSLMVVQVGAARMALTDGGGTALATARGQLLGAEQTGRSALDELRRLLGVLRDPDPRLPSSLGDPAAGLTSTEPLPGLADVTGLVDDFRRRGLDVRRSEDVAPADVDRGLGLTAYRVVHEGLTNALKHAPGSSVSVAVRGTADGVRIEVSDRGGAHVAGPGTGLGLLGLRERVAVYGGRLQAGPTDKGWRLVVDLPRQSSPQAADRLPVSPVSKEVTR